MTDAIKRAMAAERRRIRQAIRAAKAAEMARWEAMQRAGEKMRTREDCARVVQGIDVALGCVRAERRR